MVGKSSGASSASSSTNRSKTPVSTSLIRAAGALVAGLFEQFTDKGGLAVVQGGNDGQITGVRTFHRRGTLGGVAPAAGRLSGYGEGGYCPTEAPAPQRPHPPRPVKTG